MSVEGWLALALGLVLGGVLVPFVWRTFTMVRQARELNQRYQQIAKELQNIKPIFTALIGAVMNDKGEYRITKTAQKKADDIGDISWRIQKAGGLVISTKPKEVTNG